MSNLSNRVADRFMIKLAARKACDTQGFKNRQAALHDLTPEVLAAFGEAFILPNGRVAAFGGVLKKLKKLVTLFRRAPKAWEHIKSALGVDKITELPGAIREWGRRGLAALTRVMKRIPEMFPLALFFVDKHRMPGLTDMMHKIMRKHPGIAKVLDRIKGGAHSVDKWLNKYMPTLKRAVHGAVFTWVWMNVAELSWDMKFLLAGFTGGISLGELLGSLPESGIGFVAALAGLGYGALPVAFAMRIVWLVAKKYLTWVPGKGLTVHWDRITPEEGGKPETVAVF